MRLVDPSLQADCLHAKVAARLLQPGRQAWKQLLACRLWSAYPSLGPAIAVSGLQVTHGRLDPRTAAYLRGLQHTLPHRTVLPADLSTNKVLTERLFCNRQVRGPDGDMLRPDAAAWAPLVAAGLHTVRQLGRRGWGCNGSSAMRGGAHVVGGTPGPRRQRGSAAAPRPTRVPRRGPRCRAHASPGVCTSGSDGVG